MAESTGALRAIELKMEACIQNHRIPRASVWRPSQPSLHNLEMHLQPPGASEGFSSSGGFRSRAGSNLSRIAWMCKHFDAFSQFSLFKKDDPHRLDTCTVTWCHCRPNLSDLVPPGGILRWRPGWSRCPGPGSCVVLWSGLNGLQRFFFGPGLEEAVWDLSLLSLPRAHSSRSRISANIEPKLKLIELLKCHEVGWGKDNGRELLSWNPSLVSLPNPSWYCRSYPRKQLVSGVLFARGPPISALSSLHSSIIAIVLHVKLVQHLETFASKQQTECQPKECHLPYLQTGHDGFPTRSHGFTWSHSCQATLASSGPECSPRLLRKSCSTKWRQDGKQRENSELNVSACLIMSHHITIHSNSEIHYKMARLLDLYRLLSIAFDRYGPVWFQHPHSAWLFISRCLQCLGSTSLTGQNTASMLMGSSWFVNLSRALVQNSRSSNFPPKSIHFRHFYIVWDHSDHSGLSLSWASWVIMVRSPLCKIWILVAWMLLPSFQNILDLSSQHGKLKQCRLIPRIAAEKQRGQVTVTCLPLHLPACAGQNDAECILKSRRIKDTH